MNIPNALTASRILLLPILVAVFDTSLKYPNTLAILIVIIASFTDFLDGWVARRYNQGSMLGKIFDPIADKVMLTVVLILLLYKYPSFLLSILVICSLGREFIVAGLRESLATIEKDMALPVSSLGKLKTFLQMLSVIILISYYQGLPDWVFQLGILGLSLATLMSIISLCQYLNKSMQLCYSQKNI